MSAIDGYCAWAAVHASARRMVNRLTALTAQLDLLAESEPPSAAGGMPTPLESLRAEMAATTRGAKTLAQTVALQLPDPGTSSLAAVLRDTVAPVDRYLRRRETRIVVSPIPDSVEIAAPPDLLQAALATALDVLVRSARPGEIVHIAYERRGPLDVLEMRLATRGTPPERALIESHLVSLRTWMETRSGTLDVSYVEGAISIALALPKALGPSEHSP